MTADSVTTTGDVTVGDDIVMADTKSINDGNDNEVIKISQTTSAVNELTVKNAATGNAVQLQATGDDTNIYLPSHHYEYRLGCVLLIFLQRVHWPNSHSAAFLQCRRLSYLSLLHQQLGSCYQCYYLNLQWFSYGWNTSGPGVSYNMSDVVAVYVPVGIKEL